MIYEALDEDGVRERSLVAPVYSAVDLGLLAWVAENSDASLVLFVDDCSPLEMEELRKYTSYSEGRLRLIAVSDRVNRRTLPDAQNLEVPPLSQGAVERLLPSPKALRSRKRVGRRR